jgi:putative transposase
MLPMWFQAMLMVLFEAWAARRDVQIRFLKVQVEMLRERLPGNRVIVSPEERSRLLKLGTELNHQVDDLMGWMISWASSVSRRTSVGSED